MHTLAIIGAQWGDEGKGKITDLLCQKSDLVVRYQGGNNAGHTIVFGTTKIVLHQIPSGILHNNCVSVIGHGVVFEPEAFLQELEEIKPYTNVTPDQLKLSLNATVITSYHKLIDGLREGAAKNKIGTTNKGIGPAYEDKIARRAVKVKDLLDKQKLSERLEVLLSEKAFLFEHLYKSDFPKLEDELERLYTLGQKIKPFITDTFSFIDEAVKAKKKILFEGAQGILLDIDYGSYPYVTSSSTGMAGVFTGAGLSTGVIDERLGIVKAYTTRVGSGPFPTEIFEPIGEQIQQIGNEFGATTGRKRRCGWLDLPMLKYAVKSSALTSIALTKVDVLSGLDELKICYAYQIQGQQYDCAYPGLDLEQVTPLYKSLTPFTDDFKDNKIYSIELQEYLYLIESELGIPIGMLAYGPERDEINFRRRYFK